MIKAIDKKYCIGDLVQLMPYTDSCHLIVNADEIILLKVGDKVLVNKYANHPSRNLFPYHEKEQNDKNHFTELFEYNKTYLNFRGSVGGFSFHQDYFFKGSERALYLDQSLPVDDRNAVKDSIELSRQEIEELFDSSNYDSMYVIDRNGRISFARNDKDKICIGKKVIPSDDEIVEMVRELDENEFNSSRILFLDASDEELVARYKETRRSHPLAMEGRILDGIHLERELLAPIKSNAQIIIDTSKLSPRQLREEIFKNFEARDTKTFHIEVMSFGFKYGLPIDADIVMDVRFLPNPYYVPELRNKTGKDDAVYEYVMKSEKTEEFYQKFVSLLKYVIPGYIAEGKSNVTIAIGCTGGQHRSVALAERIGNELSKEYPVHMSHRDMNKRKETVNRS